MSEAYEEVVLPHNLDYERVLLGSVLLDNTALEELSPYLLPDDFYSLPHRRIWNAMRKLAEQNRAIEPVVVGALLREEGVLEACGGITGLSRLMYGLPFGLRFEEYVRTLKELAHARQMIRLFNSGIAEIMEDYRRAREWETQLATWVEQAPLNGDAPVAMKQTVADSVALLESWRDRRISAVPIGIPELEEKLVMGGWYPQEITVVAARTSVGKTAFTLQAAVHAARCGVPALIFSLEMDRTSLAFRVAGQLTGIPTHRFSPKSFHFGRGDELMAAMRSLDSLPLFLGDRTNDVNRIIANARQMVRSFGVKLIVIDYIGLVQTYSLNRRFATTHAEITYIMAAFKDEICRALNVPLLLPVQINRVSLGEKRRPEAHDLKDSGSQEQDAHNILIIYTPNGTVQTDERIRPVNLYCPKQRNGPRDWELGLEYDVQHQLFWTPEMRSQAAAQT